MTHAAQPRIMHGGRLDEARRLFPQAPFPWIDLSTGINPRPYPLPPLEPEVFARLPAADALAALERAAAWAYRVPASLEVVAGAGAQTFIQWLPRLVPARRVAILGFTYAEHAAQWAACDADTAAVETLDELASFDVPVVVNPNNPDGRLVPPQRLAEVAREMAARGGLLVVDESFMDFSPAASVVPHLPEDGAIVLRSFGKVYGLPGLRLGFAPCSFELAESLRAAMGPWSVGGPAIAVGMAALYDAHWLAEAGAVLERAAGRLDALLERAGFAIVGGTTLFRLAAHDDAGAWFARLGEAGILTRPFAERPHWLRFGLPGVEDHWERLTRALGGGHGA